MKKIFGFSLVELMVTLIIISCIIGAMTPMITKKLKSQAISLKQQQGSTIITQGSEFQSECSTIDSNCSLCNETKCVVCNNGFNLNSEGLCEAQATVDINSLVEHPITSECSSAVENCAICNGDKTTCVVCNDGYVLSEYGCVVDPNLPVWDACTEIHSKCVSCTANACLACSKGYHVNTSGTCTKEAHTVVKSCNKVDENCRLCSENVADTGLCYACIDGYELNESNICTPIWRDVTQQDCNILNAVFIPSSATSDKNICVLKYNPGDMGIPIATRTNCSTVASQCNDNVNWEYSPCSRTICKFSSMDINCEYLNIAGYTNWRLPTKAEAANFKAYSDGLGANGLMLCGHGVDTSITGRCGGDTASGYYPHYLATKDGAADHNIYKLDNDSWIFSTIGEASTGKFTYRCILDKIRNNI